MVSVGAEADNEVGREDKADPGKSTGGRTTNMFVKLGVLDL